MKINSCEIHWWTYFNQFRYTDIVKYDLLFKYAICRLPPDYVNLITELYCWVGSSFLLCALILCYLSFSYIIVLIYVYVTNYCCWSFLQWWWCHISDFDTATTTSSNDVCLLYYKKLLVDGVTLDPISWSAYGNIWSGKSWLQEVFNQLSSCCAFSNQELRPFFKLLLPLRHWNHGKEVISDIPQMIGMFKFLDYLLLTVCEICVGHRLMKLQ